MDAILFCANPSVVEIDDAIRHLAAHEELYWRVPFPIAKSAFCFPMFGFIHLSGSQVEYRAVIRDFLPFAPTHYENDEVKRETWRREWKENPKIRAWKTSLVITEIEPFSFDTYAFQKRDGSPVRTPPRSYVRVLVPSHASHAEPQSVTGATAAPGAAGKPTASKSSIAERHLEDFVIQQLQSIEPGLHLVNRQLSTPAGRMDLLCVGADGYYVVVELKRTQGTNQVVGQILRYVGWVREAYNTKKVLGIIVVARKDSLLSYAVIAVPNIVVKEFKLWIE